MRNRVPEVWGKLLQFHFIGKKARNAENEKINWRNLLTFTDYSDCIASGGKWHEIGKITLSDIDPARTRIFGVRSHARHAVQTDTPQSLRREYANRRRCPLLQLHRQ